MTGRCTQRSKWGREAHPEVRKAHLEVQEGLGGPPKGPVGVGRPSRWFGRGREAHSKVRDGSSGPPGGLRVGNLVILE